jgi:hypothetical protein
MEFSRSEIDGLAQRARHQLKAFAAGLAVSLARESIRIDKTTDEVLVKNFNKGLEDKQFAQTTASPPPQGNRQLVARM